ncbi:MAG: hypothetical protein HYR96_13630 [Deltaproteobacteria bacterium]|nr:hypothetical protein [Deltaproteobacteria bacterium]MBI3293818.1 hypothetical protein [Deltaproteobacteria bacterium]
MRVTNYYSLLRGLAPLGHLHRRAIAVLLGLQRTEWTISERLGGVEFDRYRIEAFPKGTGREGTVTVNHVPPNLPEVPARRKLSLARHLLPYPFSIFSATENPAETVLKVEGEGADSALRLIEILSVIEQLLHSVEFLWLRLSGNEISLNLLFHCVRKEILKAGVIEPTHELQGLFSCLGSVPLRLDEFIGTRAAFLPLETGAEPGFEALKCLESQVLSFASSLLGFSPSRVPSLSIT